MLTAVMSSSSSNNPSDEWSLPDLMPFAIMDETLRCPICKDFFKGCVQLPCSHRFCSLCVRSYSNSKMECPSCRSSIPGMHVVKPDKLINVLVEQFQTIRQQYLGKLNSLVASGTTSKIAVQQRKCDVETPFQPDDVYNNGIVDTEIDVPIYDTRKRSSAVSAASSNANVPKKRRGEPASDHSEIPSHTSRTHTSPRKFTSPTKKMSQKDVTVRSLFRKQETRNPSSTSSTSSQLQPGIEEQVNCPICNKCVLMKFLNPHLDSGCETHVHHTTAPRIEIPERDEVVNSDIEVINEITRPREDVDYSPIKEPQESGTRRSTRSSRRLASSQADTAKLEPMPSIPQPSLEQEMARISSYLKQDNSNKATKKPKSSVPYSMLKDAKIRSLLTEDGLSTRGDRSTLIRRHTQWILRYNANLDRMHPLPVEKIREELSAWESSTQKFGSMSSSSSSSDNEAFRSTHHRYASDVTTSDPRLAAELVKLRQHSEKYKEEFDELIEQVRQRVKAKKQKKEESPAQEIPSTVDQEVASPEERTRLETESINKEPVNSEHVLAQVECTDT